MHAASFTWARRTAVGLACLATASAQAAPTPGLAPLATITDVLAGLDAAFGRGDAAAYVARFAADDPTALALLQQQLARVFAMTTTRQRTSVLVGEPRQVGAHTVVRVRHALDLHAGPRATLSRTTCTEEILLALRPAADGRWAPTLAVEAAPAEGAVRGDRLRCPACNYQIGDVPGWLCVPLRNDRADALEAASFHLLGSDVVCDVSVQVDPERRPPNLVAQQLADTLRQLQPADGSGAPATPLPKLGLPEAWLPAAHAAAPPSGLRGARLEVDWPAAGDDGRRVVLHVATFGGLQHLLLLRGRASALRTHAAAIAALLGSYQLLERDRDLVLAAAEPLAHHTGGELTGSTYHNHRFKVELVGAEGWRPVMLAGGAAFRVVWSSPPPAGQSPAGHVQGRLWLTGYLVPPGLGRWCEATADRWLAQQCERRGLDLLAADAGTTAWQQAVGCDATRTLVGHLRQPASPDTPRRRWFRLLLRDDLLLVVDGFAATAADEAALQKMLASLRRE